MTQKLMIACLLVTMLYGTSLSPQDQLAAIIIVEHSGVQVQRGNTAMWLSLRPGAIAPIGPDDTLRTDETGRAIISIPGAAETLLLPNTGYRLNRLTERPDSDGLTLVATLDGQIIQRTLTPQAFSDYELNTEYAVVDKPAELFAAWSAADYGSVITVATGIASVSSRDSAFLVSSGDGLRVSADSSDRMALEGQLTAPHLIGLLDGCPGTIRTNSQNLNVRVGPGTNTTIIGNIPNNAQVRVMAQSESQNWLRIQFLSGFGWISATLVEHACEELVTRPNSSFEINVGLFGISQIELEYLLPFYGAPEDDLWLYRTLVESGD